MLNDKFTASYLVIVKGDIDCVKALNTRLCGVVVLEEYRICKVIIQCIAFIKKSLDAVTIECQDTDEVPPSQFKIIFVKHISFSLGIYQIFNIVFCLVILNTLQQQKLYNVGLHNLNLINVLENRFLICVFVLTLNTYTPFTEETLESNVVGIISF